MTMTMKNTRSDERGNALFLILIAVVLFAALSYAITQSNRGGGAPNKETSLVSSTTVTQYSSSIRTGITRMLLRNVAIADLDFDDPATPACAGTSADADRVFCPEGGGVSFQLADVNTVESTGEWSFDTTSSVANIGTAADDVVAYLSYVREPICRRIVEQIYGQGHAIPAFAVAISAAPTGLTLTGADISGQPFGCFEATAASGDYVYYHVLAEN